MEAQQLSGAFGRDPAPLPQPHCFRRVLSGAPLGMYPRLTDLHPSPHLTCSPNELGGVGAVTQGRPATPSHTPNAQRHPPPPAPLTSPREVSFHLCLRVGSLVLVLHRAPHHRQDWGAEHPVLGVQTRQGPLTRPARRQRQATLLGAGSAPGPTRSTSQSFGAPGRLSPPPQRSPSTASLPRPRRRGLHPGPAGLPRCLSVLAAVRPSVQPQLSPGTPAQPRPCPRGSRGQGGGQRTHARPRPSACRAQSSGALAAQPHSAARPGQSDCGRSPIPIALG